MKSLESYKNTIGLLKITNKGNIDLHIYYYYAIMIERLGESDESNLPNDWDDVCIIIK